MQFRAGIIQCCCHVGGQGAERERAGFTTVGNDVNGANGNAGAADVDHSAAICCKSRGVDNRWIARVVKAEVEIKDAAIANELWCGDACGICREAERCTRRDGGLGQ